MHDEEGKTNESTECSQELFSVEASRQDVPDWITRRWSSEVLELMTKLDGQLVREVAIVLLREGCVLAIALLSR